MMMDMPPAIETVRQALLMQPPPVIAELEVPPSSELGAYFSKYNAAVDNVEKIGKAYLQQIKSGIDTLTLLSSDPTVSLGHIETLIKGAEQGLAMAAEMTSEGQAVRARLLPLAARLGVRAQMKRLTDRMILSAVDYHDGLVRQTLRLKALAADLDPNSAVSLATASSLTEVSDFFASLRAS